MARLDRVLAAASCIALVFLATGYAAAAVLIGIGNAIFFALLGVYALALAAVGVRLVIRGSPPQWVWLLSIALPIAPLAATLLLRAVLPPADASGAPDPGPWTWGLHAFSAGCSLAAFVVARTRVERVRST